MIDLTDKMIQSDLNTLTKIIFWSIIGVSIIFIIFQYITAKKRKDNNYSLVYMGIIVLVISSSLYLIWLPNLLTEKKWYVVDTYITKYYDEYNDSPRYYIEVNDVNGRVQTCGNCYKKGDKVYAIVDDKNEVIEVYDKERYKYVGNRLKKQR